MGGVADLRRRLIRCIGDPDERFVEDPVRMLRAIAFAARLDFRLDAPVREGIARHREEIRNASPARLVEEIYKLLRSGAATRIFKRLSRTGLLRHLAPEVNRPRSEALWRSLEALDAYRARFDEAPDTLSNAILLGSLVAPVQEIDLRPPRRDARGGPLRVSLGDLPVARRDVEHLRQVLALQPLLRIPACRRARSGRSWAAAAFPTRSRGSRFTGRIPIRSRAGRISSPTACRRRGGVDAAAGAAGGPGGHRRRNDRGAETPGPTRRLRPIVLPPSRRWQERS